MHPTTYLGALSKREDILNLNLIFSEKKLGRQFISNFEFRMKPKLTNG